MIIIHIFCFEIYGFKDWPTKTELTDPFPQKPLFSPPPNFGQVYRTSSLKDINGPTSSSTNATTTTSSATSGSGTAATAGTTPTTTTTTAGTTPTISKITAAASVGTTPSSTAAASTVSTVPSSTSTSSSAAPAKPAPPAPARRLLGSLRDEDEGSDSEESDDCAWRPSESSDESSVAETLPSEQSEDEEGEEDISVIPFVEEGREKVTSLINADTCYDDCLQGKAEELENFLYSMSYMSPHEKKQSILVSLATLMKTDTAVRRRGGGIRNSFAYYLPLVGRVCRDSWCALYGVSTATVTRYRRQIQGGCFSLKLHKGHLNQNATKIEIRWLATWFKAFAATVGDVVPVRVRTQKTVDGVVRKLYSAEDHTLLPANFTWDQLNTEMHNYVTENELDVPSRELKQSPSQLSRGRNARKRILEGPKLLAVIRLDPSVS